MNKFILKPNQTLKSAMTKLSEIGKKTMVVADDNHVSFGNS